MLCWFAGLLKSGKLSPVTGSERGATGCDTAFPILSCHSEKMVDLYAADAEQDAQHFLTSGLERQDGIQTGTALLDKCEMNSGHIRDRLYGALRVVIL